MIALEQKLLRNKDIAWRGVEDEGLLVDPRKGKVYPLDPVSFRIWQMSEGAIPLAQVVKTLLEEFDVSEEILKRDVEDFIQELLSEDLIEIVQP